MTWVTMYTTNLRTSVINNSVSFLLSGKPVLRAPGVRRVRDQRQHGRLQVSDPILCFRSRGDCLVAGYGEQ